MLYDYHFFDPKNTYVLQLFRDNQIFTAIFVVIYFLFFSVNIWLYPNSSLTSFGELPSTLSNWGMSWIMNPFSNKISFSILLLVQAFALNTIVNQFKLAKQYSFVPAICFILLHFSYNDIDSCSPVMVGNTFLLWSLYSMFGSYEKRVSMGTIFNIGFSAAIAGLLYNGFLAYFLWIVIGVLIVRSFDLQEIILLFMGFFVPFFLLGTYHFLGDNLGNWIDQELLIHLSNMTIHYDTNTELYLLLGIMVVPFLLTAVNMQGLYFKTTSREKKYINVVLIMPIIGLLSFFVQNELYSYHFVLFIVPISILLSLVLQSYKSLALSEAVHFVLFMICIGIQYQAFFFE